MYCPPPICKIPSHKHHSPTNLSNHSPTNLYPIPHVFFRNLFASHQRIKYIQSSNAVVQGKTDALKRRNPQYVIERILDQLHLKLIIRDNITTIILKGSNKVAPELDSRVSMKILVPASHKVNNLIELRCFQ